MKKTPTINAWRISCVLTSMFLASFSISNSMAQPAGGMGSGARGPLTVGVVTLEKTNVPQTVTLPGRAIAYEQVDIRPRVNGIISEIVYEPGKPVKVGDLLYRIDNETYSASVQSAEADVASAEAGLSEAKDKLSRYKSLKETSISKADLLSADVAVQKAEASLKTAQANLRKAKLEFGWTEMRSPIAGVPEVSNVSVGAIVTANQASALTTITRFDPIYVDVQESSMQIMKTRDSMENGQLGRGSSLNIKLMLETGEEYDRAGTLVSPGTSVSTTTGMIDLRLKFDNPDRTVIPGQFLRVVVTTGSTEAVLVPQGATQRSANGDLTAFFAVDGKAKALKLQEAGDFNSNWVVTDGAKAGDLVIVDNIRNVREGVDVKTTPVAFVDGIIQDVDPSKAKTETEISMNQTSVGK